MAKRASDMVKSDWDALAWDIKDIFTPSAPITTPFCSRLTRLSDWRRKTSRQLNLPNASV